MRPRERILAVCPEIQQREAALLTNHMSPKTLKGVSLTLSLNLVSRLLISILFLTGSAFSQAQMSSGNVKGTVTDPTGAVVAGAGVAVTNIDTGLERSSTSDAMGEFRFF